MTPSSDPRFAEYLRLFGDRVREQRLGESVEETDASPVAPREAAFTHVFLETLGEIGQLPEPELVYFEKKLGRAVGKVNAYAIREFDGHLDLVTTVHDDDPSDDESIGPRSVPGSRIEIAARRALHVFAAANQPVYERMEPSSPAFDMMEALHTAYDSLQTVRITILVDGLAQKSADFEIGSVAADVTVDVWDLERLFRADSSGLPYEPFTIDLHEYLDAPLYCIPAPESERDHRCFLTVMPGSLLHDLYHTYGPRLLELNVRSFLQARGKVNRGIRDTILREPGRFLAFNNGISITAESVEFEENGGGPPAIRSIRGLQIVNGGQTVASIHRAKFRDKADLSKINVQAKLTVVEPEQLDALVPFISRYANTQNKVNETDFSANHPFHVSMQKLSEQIWAPGETSRWFYERARGQWEVARSREGTTPARLRAFDQKTPRGQRVDKTLLAKAVNAWSELPHVVSLGGQKNFVRFMEGLAHHGEQWQPDESYYRDTIAKIVVFTLAERIGRQIAFSAYRANAVCYAVALLAYRTSGRVDLASVWNHQRASAPLEETLRSWMPIVHGEIIESAGSRNVTEWCKRKECWSHIQTISAPFVNGFEDELAAGLPTPNVGQFKEGRNGKARALTSEERDRQARTMRYGPDEWVEMIRWGRESGMLSDFHLKLAGTVLGYSADGWRQIPSPKQTRHTTTIIDLWMANREEPDEGST